jgi:hypothetical protein
VSAAVAHKLTKIKQALAEERLQLQDWTILLGYLMVTGMSQGLIKTAMFQRMI